MGRGTTRIPMSHHVLSPNKNSDTCYVSPQPHDQPPVRLCGSIFGFLEEEEEVEAATVVLWSLENDIQRDAEDDDESENENHEDKIKFWETQHQNLHKTLFRTTSLESKIRSVTKEALREVGCSCSSPLSGGCRSCRMRQVCSRLQNSGYDAAICKSKWNNLYFPPGEHTFLDVIDSSDHKKGMVRVIIELELRGHFEMKKGSEEYNGLVRELPDIFVGKSDRLQTVIEILSTAAKTCMREKKMHLGPWRKQRYMQAKWLRVTERSTVCTMIKPLAEDECSTRPARVRTSMLTMDLLDDLPNVSCFYGHVVEVL
ncbi:hypothetical protein R6Q57_027658 [Mikania cordata]